MKRYLNVIFVFFVLTITFSCTDNDVDPNLKKFVEKYYSLQQNKMWHKTYELRIPAFKKITDKKYYQDEMDKNDKGWKLNSFEIIDSNNNDAGRVVVKIKFNFTIRTEKESKEITLFENTTWENIEGQWYCYNAGHQYHLPLNDSIVRD